MNFLEAVKTLQKGQCDSIRIKDGVKFFLLPDGFLDSEDSRGESRGPSSVEAILGEWELVNYKPKYTTETVTRYDVYDSDGDFIDSSKDKKFLESTYKYPNYEIITLTGTRQVVEKQTVIKREEVNVPLRGQAFPRNTKFYAEWEE